jgi:uncharacterized protein (DUF1697 family)
MVAGVSRFAVFLRGMNVGGHRLTNEDLRAHLTTMGFADVATFRASGNVVLSAGRSTGAQLSEQALAREIERGLAAALGYQVPTFIRSAAEIVAMAEMQPFSRARARAPAGEPAGKLQVALLSEPPPARTRKAVLALADERDGLAFGPRELYWLPSGPTMHSTLDLKAIERLLGTMTLRTKGTIEQIAGKHFGERDADTVPAAR